MIYLLDTNTVSYIVKGQSRNARRCVAGEAGFDVTYLRRRSEGRALDLPSR